MAKIVGSINGWFDERRYGWVNANDNDGVLTRFFLHHANLVSGIPAKGKIVRFESVRNAKGYLCIDAEVFADRKEMERSDAAAALLVNSTGGGQ